MKSTSGIFLALLGAASAYPLTARSDCATDGALVCNGSGQFAICNGGSAYWMAVSGGTECVCAGSTCTIAASGSTDAPVAPDTTVPDVALAPAKAVPDQPPAPAPTTAAPVSVQVGAHQPPPSQEASPVAPSPSAPAPAPPAPTPAAPSPAAPSPAAPSPSAASSSGSGVIAGVSVYLKTFLGTGDVSAGWPEQSSWVSFDSMWSSNLDIISNACTQFGQANNSPQESADLKSAIQSVAQSSGVDERFVLAVVMQESNGCVRAPTSNFGVENPGIMQSHDGAHSCANTSPCPQDQIVGMIQDGTDGTAAGPGLKQLIAQTGVSDVSRFYKAAVLYNSGSIPANGILEDGFATKCYASDIANRLVGWSQGRSGCSV